MRRQTPPILPLNTPVAGCLHAEIVEDGDNVGGHRFRRVGRSVARLIALPVAPRVDQDEAVFGLQGRNEAVVIPKIAANAKAVLEDERWSIALDPVVDRNAFVVDAGH